MSCNVMYCMYLCMYVCMYVCIYVCMYVCIYVCMYLCMYVCMYLCMYVCMYVCVFVCMCVRTYIQNVRQFTELLRRSSSPFFRDSSTQKIHDFPSSQKLRETFFQPSRNSLMLLSSTPGAPVAEPEFENWRILTMSFLCTLWICF